ncbi:MAG: heparinase II/III family protein [Anaerolineae bacterium]|nr:heparinase II/III family protein [Anaerolineae bacterium]
MKRPTKQQLKNWLAAPHPVENLREIIRRSPTTPLLLDAVRKEIPDITGIPELTYTLYREFERNGVRGNYENPYFLKRAKLTRAVLEYIMGQAQMLDHIHDLAWNICEETSWVLPAHEEQGPRYWEIEPPHVRAETFGAHTALTREPDAIDLFAAETGAALAETVYLLGDELLPEVRQRIRHEVQRRIFKPYLAYARGHWWFKGALNWNGVCNGSIGLAFLRLENNLETLAEALALVLEGFEAYIATGFEADGGSIEGVGYWDYGLMYYITVAELLREITGGELDLLAQPRLKDIASYPVGMALAAPDRFINYGDATERQHLAVGVVNRLVERTGVDELRALFVPLDRDKRFGFNPISKLPVIMRHAAWWDETQATPDLEPHDFYLPDSGVIKFTGQTTDGRQVILSAKAGHNGGHHSHTDVATFILNVGGESLIPDAGRGLYSKQYFREQRYDNIFNNSYSHNVPRFDGALQAADLEFGGAQRFYGTIIEQGERDDSKTVVIDFDKAYNLPALTHARRILELDKHTGVVELVDTFECSETLTIEEAFVSWYTITPDGSMARIEGDHNAVELVVMEPAGVRFEVESLEAACRENKVIPAPGEKSTSQGHGTGILTRLTVTLPVNTTHFRMRITPQ